MPRHTFHSYDYYNIEEQSVSAPDSVRRNPLEESDDNQRSRKFSFEEADTSDRDIKDHTSSQPIAIPKRKNSEQSWQSSFFVVSSPSPVHQRTDQHPSFFIGSPSEDPDENPALSRLERLHPNK